MGGTEAPQWLLSAWRRSVQTIGATADRATIESTGQALIERWRSQERVHHNLKRLIAVLARVDELAEETHEPELVRVAAWYHGAVFTNAAQQAYAHRGGADAEGSAALARTDLAALGVPNAVIDRVGELIGYLSRHLAPADDIDAQALCDADLGGLAAEPQRYESYRREVRAEYSHIPERDYVEARLAIVGKLLARRALFTSPLGRSWENAARDNLRAEQARLESELRTLPEREDDAPSHVAEIVAAKMATIAAEPPAEDAKDAPAEPEPLTAAERVDVARRAARERANERRAAAAADRDRRRIEKEERAARRAQEREAAKRGPADDDGSSMSRPPSI